MFINKIINFFLLAIGFSCIYAAVLISLDTFSQNKSDRSPSFLPSVQAKLNFYQNNSSSGLKTYSSSGSEFWSSPDYYNASFENVLVTIDAEEGPDIYEPGVIVTRISRSSH